MMNIVKRDKLFGKEELYIKNNSHILFLIISLIYYFFYEKYEMYVLTVSVFQIATMIAYLYVNVIKNLYVENRKPKITEYIDVNLFLLIILNITNIVFIFYKMKFEYYFVSYFLQSILEYIQINKINKYKCQVNCDNGNIVNLYLGALIFNYFSKVFMNCGLYSLVCIGLLVKGILFCVFYKYTIDMTLTNSMFIIKRNLNYARKRKKDLNCVLNRRNVILSETNAIIKKKEDKYKNMLECIYGGVFMFIDNRLKYTNNIEEKLDISKEEICGMDIYTFLSYYFSIDLDYIKKHNNYLPSIHMKHNDLEVELYFCITESMDKIIYVKDKTTINENLKAKKELEEYLLEDKVKQNFFESISNELKKPINDVFECIEANTKNIDNYDFDSYDNNRRIIKKDCLKIIKTINNFIDFNKISEGYITPNMQVHNIVELMDNIVESCNRHPLLSDNPIIFDTEEEEIYVKCDDELINRIFLNIISNSVKYNLNGERIYINISVSDGETNISVRNNFKNKENIIIPIIFNDEISSNKGFKYLKQNSELGILLVKPLVLLQYGKIDVNYTEEGYSFDLGFKLEENCFLYDENYTSIDTIDDKVEMELSDIFS